MEDKQKTSFLFNIAWRDVLMDYPAEVRYEVYDAIIEYAASGRLSELKPLAKMAFSFIKYEMDNNQRKYDEKVERNRINGSKGGAPKGNTNAMLKQPKQPKTTETTKNNQTVEKTTETTLNDYDNDKDKEIVSTNIEPIKKGTNVPKENTRPPSERYVKFTQLLGKDCPYISGHYSHLISEDEFDRLMDKFTAKDVWDTIQQIENRVDLRKKYTNLYRTLLNWLKRDNIPKQ